MNNSPTETDTKMEVLWDFVLNTHTTVVSATIMVSTMVSATYTVSATNTIVSTTTWFKHDCFIPFLSAPAFQ